MESGVPSPISPLAASSSEDEYFPHRSLRHTAGVRTIYSLTQVQSPLTQSAIFENNTEGDSIAADTRTPSPVDPFLTPGTSAPPGSVYSPVECEISTGSSFNPISAEITTLAGVHILSSSFVNSNDDILPVPPLPAFVKRPLRSAVSAVDISVASSGGIRSVKRETFSPPPPMLRRPSTASFGTSSSIRHVLQRPGITGMVGSDIPTCLSPPGSANSLPGKSSQPGVASQLGVIERLTTSRFKPKRMQSSMLRPDSIMDKPWMNRPDSRVRAAYFLTYGFWFIGFFGSFLRIFFGRMNVQLLEGNLCLVLEDEFNGNQIDTTKWGWDVQMNGFGTGEFEMTTNSPNNSFIEDGVLYIVPTLTSDVIGSAAVFDGFTYNITGCTASNASLCGAVSNITSHSVIKPIQSARLTTKNSSSIKFGRVEIRARNPSGDWIWPALWMLPVNNIYGPWPISGEIDIMESRGNGRSYKAQGNNYVRSSLNWGPLTWLSEVSKTYGWWKARRNSYADDFHVYALEWSDRFIRAYVDERLHYMLHLTFDKPFFDRGDFPPAVLNGSQEITVPNPWGLTDFAAPFDQPFYLIMDVAVGGTNGWFPDNVGNKPWLDESSTPIYDFARSQNTWYATWPKDVRKRALAVDYVKMWQLC